MHILIKIKNKGYQSMRSVNILSGFEVLIISLTECNSGTTPKLFAVNTMIELKILHLFPTIPVHLLMDI